MRRFAFGRKLLAQGRFVSTLVAATALYASSANAYQTIRDQSLFQSLYENPTNLIDFTRLKDGSIFSNASSSEFVTTTSPGHYTVRQEGWSNDIWIGSTQEGCNCAWTATNWYGSYIGIGGYDRLYINIPGHAPVSPIAINTSAGFVGFVPTHASDAYFLLDRGVTISSVEYGFSAVPAAPIPEPETYAMMLAGLGLLSFAVRRRKLRPH